MNLTEKQLAAWQRKQSGAAPSVPVSKPKHNARYEMPHGNWGSVRNGWLFLPLPPSVNHAYRDIIIKGKSLDGKEYSRPQRLLSKEARGYKEAATSLAVTSGLEQVKGKVSLTVCVWGRGRIDLMNLEKLLVDSVKQILFEDDHRICQFTIFDSFPMLEGTAAGVAVRVQPFVASLPPTGHLFTEVD